MGWCVFSCCHSSLYTEENNIQYVKVNNNPYYILHSVTNKNLSTYQINHQTKVIASDAFYGCKRLTSINFDGTTTEWDAITKSSYWNSSVPVTEVVCSDGKVSLS